MKAISKLKDDARKHEQKEEWEKAIQAYLQVLRQGDEGEGDVELPLFNRIGDLCVRLGRPLEAVKHYEEAADRYAEAGLFNNAIALCNKALRYQPTRLELLRKLGQFSASQGFLTDARRYFLEFAEKQFTAGAVDEALAALRDFADVAEDGEIRELLARRLQAHGRTRDAVEELRKAHAIHFRAGATAQAQAVAAELAALDPDAAAGGLPVDVPAPTAPALDEGDDELPGLAELDLPALTDAADSSDAPDPAQAPTAGSAIEGFESTGIGTDETAGRDDVTGFDLPGLATDETTQDAAPDFELPALDLPDFDTPADEVDEADDEADAGLAGSFDTIEGLESTTLDFSAVSDITPMDMGLDIERDETSFDGVPDDAFMLPQLDDHAPGDDPDSLPDEGGFELPSLVGDESVPDDDFGSFQLGGTTADSPALDDVDTSPGADDDAFELPTLDAPGEAAGTFEVPALDTGDEPGDVFELPSLADDAGVPDDEAGAFADSGTLDGTYLPALDDADAAADEDAEEDADDDAGTFELPTLEDSDSAVGELELPALEDGDSAVDEFELPALEDDDNAVDEFDLPAVEDVDRAIREFELPALDAVDYAVSEFELPPPATDAADAADDDIFDHAGDEADQVPGEAKEPAAPDPAGDVPVELPTLTESEDLAWPEEPAAFGTDMFARHDGSDDDVADAPLEPEAVTEDPSVAGQSRADDWLDDIAGPYTDEAGPAAPGDDEAPSQEPPHEPAREAVDTDGVTADAYTDAYADEWTPDSLAASEATEPGPDDATTAPDEADAPQQAADADTGFVDLGSLLDDDDAEGTRFTVQESAPTGDEDQDFAELLSQFKAKISEHLPPEDAAAHYDLGLAFKEMGLVDEAIAEFQIALRASELRLKVYEELGDCFLLKDQYNIAEKVLRRALDIRYNDELELLGVYYHLGRAYEGMGKRDQARDAYERVLGMDINFGDVTERLARL